MITLKSKFPVQPFLGSCHGKNWEKSSNQPINLVFSLIELEEKKKRGKKKQNKNNINNVTIGTMLR
jgi:hypothetical protein